MLEKPRLTEKAVISEQEEYLMQLTARAEADLRMLRAMKLHWGLLYVVMFLSGAVAGVGYAKIWFQ